MPEGSSPAKSNTSFQLPTIELSNSIEKPHQLTTTTKHVVSDCKIENGKTENEIKTWTVEDVVDWARSAECFSNDIVNCLKSEKIDGEVLLSLCEDDIRDMRYRLNYQLPFGDMKKLWLLIRGLQEHYKSSSSAKDTLLVGVQWSHNDATPIHRRQQTLEHATCEAHTTGCYILPSECTPNVSHNDDGNGDLWVHETMMDGPAVNIPPEFFKTFMSLGYSFLVTWITSFVMVIVHERVPDMKRYPPLPDIFLDNVPHIPWAFNMCEITGTLLFAIWACVCVFHKYRMVLLRRFFALAGTVFLLRCVTMLITSLSVPGTHLQCDQSDYAVDDADLTLSEALELRISRAYTIWSGLGMSIQGVRTCGDYMFSGHTVALTLLNFFITEYTPRNLYFLHTLTWLLNMFGIFFILAAHEHYSIDVFVAFYITSRLFLYYHTLANNQALMSRDSTRTRIWFPMFSYFESSVDGIIPNEFDTLSTLLEGLLQLLMEVKDACMLTAQRLSFDRPHLALATKNLLLLPIVKQHRNVATSTHSVITATGNLQTPISTSSTDLNNDNSKSNSSGNVTPSKTTKNNNNNCKTSSTASTALNKPTKNIDDRELNLKLKFDHKKQL